MPGEPRGLLVRMGAQLDTSRLQPFLVPPFYDLAPHSATWMLGFLSSSVARDRSPNASEHTPMHASNCVFLKGARRPLWHALSPQPNKHVLMADPNCYLEWTEKYLGD